MVVIHRIVVPIIFRTQIEMLDNYMLDLEAKSMLLLNECEWDRIQTSSCLGTFNPLWTKFFFSSFFGT